MPASESPLTVNTPSQLPLSFIANAGQTDSDVHFQVRGAGHTIFFTSDEVVLSASGQVEDQTVDSVVRSQLVGANSNPAIVGLNSLPGVANFLLGNDPSQWYTNVPTYDGVVYQNVYEGIDRVFKGSEGELKSEFIVAPGANPGQIRINFSGVEGIELRADGALVLQTPLGELIEAAPYIYQDIDGQRYSVQGAYTLLGNNQVGFTLGAYNPAYTLVIDPVLEYTTYLGGNGNGANGFEEVGNGIAVDATGIYVTGSTPSANFPVTPGAVQPALNPAIPNTTDVFVTKLDPTGSTLLYSTFIGGAGSDVAGDIALDGAGNIHLTGVTSSPSTPAVLAFPTINAVQATFGGGLTDAFVTKLNAAGNGLLYSSYLGGNGADGAFKLAVDGAGNVYVTGGTQSVGVAAFSTGGALQANNNGDADAFLTQLSADGVLLYGTYFGGSQFDSGNDIQVDSAGNVYITGDTDSAPDSPIPFTITAGALQPTFGGIRDAFVVKLNLGTAAPAPQLLYSTYYGGDGLDSGDSIGLDSLGNIYIAGDTESTNLTPVNAAQPTFGGVRDTFVAKLNAVGDTLVYTTYLGGSQSDSTDYIAVDSAGNAYVAGETLSGADYPVVNPLQAYGGGDRDAFAAMLNPNGVVFYNTYLGGNGYDEAFYITVDNEGNAYVTGQTSSTDFSTPGAYQTTYGGGNRDAFLTKIRPNIAPVLNDAGTPSLTTINEDDITNLGSLVSGIIASGSTANSITDPDPGALQGIAVTAVDNTNGTWEFSIDGGSVWTAFGTPSETEARLLASDANTRVRFVPIPNFSGIVATGITFRAWDQTIGLNGSTANIISIGTGGATPFSTVTETVAIAVDAVADAPPLTVTPASGNPNTAIPLNIKTSLVDIDGSENLSLQIAGVPTNSLLSAGTNLGGGIWQLTLAQLAGLAITPSTDEDFTLAVTATATEISNSNAASAIANLSVTVNSAQGNPGQGNPGQGNPGQGNPGQLLTLQNTPNNVFLIEGSGTGQLLFTLTGRETDFVNEIGVFVVNDDQGTIIDPVTNNAIAPGQNGYLEAAVSGATVIFSALSEEGFDNQNFTRQLSFGAGTRLGFYLVQDSTTDTVLADLAAGRTPPNVFFGTITGNADNLNYLQVSSLSANQFNLAWEDVSGSGNQDFNDLGVTVELTNSPPPLGTSLQGDRERELIDLTDQANSVSAEFVVNSEAAFDNFVGLYVIDDEQGTVNGLAPGQAGYAQAALQRRVVELNEDTVNLTVQLGGTLLAPYIIADATPDDFLAQNPNNVQGQGPLAYFAYLGANPDGVDHVRLLGDNSFGFEDLFGGGDKDFNDMVLEVNFA